LKVKANLIKKD